MNDSMYPNCLLDAKEVGKFGLKGKQRTPTMASLFIKLFLQHKVIPGTRLLHSSKNRYVKKPSNFPIFHLSLNIQCIKSKKLANTLQELGIRVISFKSFYLYF